MSAPSSIKKKPRFFCEGCGSEVKQKDRFCPRCGKFFASVRCPACGYTGDSPAFRNGCPVCGYAVQGNRAAKETGPGSGKPPATSPRRPAPALKTAAPARKPDAAERTDPLPLWIYVVCVALLAALCALIVLRK